MAIFQIRVPGASTYPDIEAENFTIDDHGYVTFFDQARERVGTAVFVPGLVVLNKAKMPSKN
jgi:hypothetical protein